jgi:hypothetical protein
VLGEHYHAVKPSKIHLDDHVERVIRSVPTRTGGPRRCPPAAQVPTVWSIDAHAQRSFKEKRMNWDRIQGN